MPFLFGNGCILQWRRKYGAADRKGSGTETTLEVKPNYELHIKVQGEVRSVLRDSAELAYKMGNILKPDLVDLMNLFINWGMNILKINYMDTMRKVSYGV